MIHDIQDYKTGKVVGFYIVHKDQVPLTHWFGMVTGGRVFGKVKWTKPFLVLLDYIWSEHQLSSVDQFSAQVKSSPAMEVSGAKTVLGTKSKLSFN